MKTKNLKFKIEDLEYSHKEEMSKLNDKHSNELNKILNEKDKLINKLQNQVVDLRNELSQLFAKFNELKELNSNSGVEYSNNIQNLNSQISKQIDLIESQRQDFEFRNNSIKERYDYDRSELK